MSSSNGGELDPETREAAETELTAHEAGYGPYYDDLVRELGRFSLTGIEVQSAQEKVHRKLANLEFLRNFSALLPRFSRAPVYENIPQFELEGPDAGYMFRQLQTQILWDYGGRALRQADSRPYFLIGVSPERQKDSFWFGLQRYHEILLLPATYDKGGESVPSWRDTVSVVAKTDRSFLTRRDTFISAVHGAELTEEAIQKVIDPRSGRLVLSRSALVMHSKLLGGCTVLNENVSPHKNLDTGISPEEMTDFGTAGRIAKLAAAFGLIDKTRRLLADSSAP